MVASSDDTEAQRQHTQSVERNKAAFDKLTNAFGAAIAGVLQGAPKTFSDASSEVLNRLGPAAQTLSSVMEGAEQYVGVWQDLTTRGVHFGNEIDNMAIKAGQANMKLSDLAKIVSENSEIFAGLGGSAQSGVERFLRNQQQFFRSPEYTTTLSRLQQLGMTTDVINERFLQFDTIAAISNMRNRRNDTARNTAAAQFAEEMDRLSKLTGVQADELAKQQAKVARDGQVFAFTQGIADEESRIALRSTFTRMSLMGDDIGELTKSVITRGMPDPNDPDMRALYSLAPDLVGTLHEIRAAALAQNATEVRRLQDLAAQQAADLQRNRNLLDLGTLGNATGVTNMVQRTLGGIISSAEGMSNDILREAFREEYGREATSADELARYRAQRIEREKNQQTTVNDRSSPGERALNVYLEGLRSLQNVAASLQKSTLEKIFGGIGAAADALKTLANAATGSGTAAQNVDTITMELDQKINNAISTIGMSAEEARAANLRLQAETEAARLDQAAERVASTGDATLARTLREQATELRRQADGLGSGNITPNELTQAISSAARTIDTNRNVIVSAQGNVMINDPNFVQNLMDAIRRQTDGRSTGSLGAVGKLFENFGQETLTRLHGIEAVVTPDQMQAIVQNSAMGAIRAAQSAYKETSGPNFNSNNLTGMLNTMRKKISEGSQTNSSTIDLTMLETAIHSLPDRIAQPITSEVGRLLTEFEFSTKKLSEIATNTDKTNKNTRNINGDVMRT